MKDTTLLFLVKKDGTTITDICLAMKKRGFGAGRYNGVGGKVEAGESIEEAVRREAKEEVGVDVHEITKCAELTFIFSQKEEWNQLVHVYICDAWEGEVTESEEMNPSWFSVSKVPYKDMWPDDIFWLPSILEGKELSARFVFVEGDVITEQEITIR